MSRPLDPASELTNTWHMFVFEPGLCLEKRRNTVTLLWSYLTRILRDFCLRKTRVKCTRFVVNVTIVHHFMFLAVTNMTNLA